MTTDTSPTRNRTGMAARPAPGQAMEDPRRFNVKAWLLWTVAFVSFPIAGIAAQAAVGRINDAAAALIGGLIAGAVIGAGQWLALRDHGADHRWPLVTAAAMAAGSALAAAITGGGTEVSDLVLTGAVSGATVGAAQAALLNSPQWAAVTAASWALRG